ncbi:amidohydrolase family protein [Holdemania filiformis]|uniref:Amidohydrolase-related domain-containing protein n=1 Tax=Holdemania filiformis TaxID=61171 RepID=A0A412G4K9_9FIRM|nr:amidohydrolase family protein [Holdemania filiformis]MBS5001387.1 amidohydrolase family protein [Holdemania filiformis]RGR75603.1 hypothetical protein DWY25_05045 [Holdemania filiformis]
MICITGGTVHTGKGEVLENTDILIDNGKIVEVGKDLKGKAEGFIDASGKVILPGFIDAMSELGMAVRRGEVRDNDEKSDPLTPQLKALYAYDGDCVSEQAPYTYGITALAASPSNSNILGGQMAVFRTAGINPFKMLVKDEAGMKGSVTDQVKEAYGSRNAAPMTKMGIFSLLRDALRQAQEYDENKAETKRDEKAKALKKVLAKEMPLLIAANNAAELRGVLRVCADYDLKPILALGYDIHAEDVDLLDKIQGVILGNLSYGFNAYSQKADLEGLYALYKKGLPVAMATIGNNPNGKEGLIWTAARMMRACGDSEAVLSMLTSQAAKLLGCADRIGSIEAGKDADFVVWSANPIETYEGRVEKVFMQGKVVYVQGGYQQ